MRLAAGVRIGGLLVMLAVVQGDIPWAADLSDTIARIKPGIVGIGTVHWARRPPAQLIATGFVVADGRHVLTNAHVLPENLDREHKEFLAVLSGAGHENAMVREAELVEKDAAHDVALLRIRGPAMHALALGDSEKVREGDLYAFTGFPLGMVLGMRPVTHRGIVSAITPIAIPQVSSRRLDAGMIKRLAGSFDVFQLDATAYPGNSGSPLFDPETGEVVGILNMVFVKESKESALDKPSGISYAIPINHARGILEKAGIVWK